MQYCVSVWPGVVSVSLSLFATPFIAAMCHRSSSRKIASLAALLAVLATLFSSFSRELHQLLGWRLSLQCVVLAMMLSLLVFPLYRPASLYHPQRALIVHLKQQQRKIRSKHDINWLRKIRRKMEVLESQWCVLRSRTVQTIAVSSVLNASGNYSLLLLSGLRLANHGYTDEKIGQFYVNLGVFMMAGNMMAAAVFRVQRGSVWLQYVHQLLLLMLGAANCALIFVDNPTALKQWAAGVGALIGATQYIGKMYLFIQFGASSFVTIWSLLEAVSSIGVLLAVPLTAYLDNEGDHGGVYFNSTCFVLAALVLFRLNFNRRKRHLMDEYETTACTTTHGVYTPQLAANCSMCSNGGGLPATARANGTQLNGNATSTGQQQSQPSCFNKENNRPTTLFEAAKSILKNEAAPPHNPDDNFTKLQNISTGVCWTQEKMDHRCVCKDLGVGGDGSDVAECTRRVPGEQGCCANHTAAVSSRHPEKLAKTRSSSLPDYLHIIHHNCLNLF